MSRDEFPAIRYRRKLDYSIESRRFANQAEFDAEGGYVGGWARSPKEVERDPHNPVRKPAVAKAAPVADPPKPRPRKPASGTER